MLEHRNKNCFRAGTWLQIAVKLHTVPYIYTHSIGSLPTTTAKCIMRTLRASDTYALTSTLSSHFSANPGKTTKRTILFFLFALCAHFTPCASYPNPFETLDLSNFSMEAPFLLLILVMSSLLVQNTVELATFSSRLIHRFSKEYKEVSVSRGGDVNGTWWPEKKSKEYYQILVSSDLKRQKLKLGPHYQLLFPSQGSKTMSLGNDFGWYGQSWKLGPVGPDFL